jgi:hypothetical protein
MFTPVIGTSLLDLTLGAEVRRPAGESNSSDLVATARTWLVLLPIGGKRHFKVTTFAIDIYVQSIK